VVGVGEARDDELVAAALAGDRGAFAAIFDRYSPRVLGFCTRLLNEPHTAADATQDTFVAAAHRLDQLRDPASLRPWLYAIARNECTRHGRARGRAVPTEDMVMASETAGDLSADEPAAAAAAAEVGGLLWDAADGLDESDRILLELHIRHGLEGAELAEAAGVAPGQISMVTGRMRERVARSVGALLIARKGRADCAGLQVVLAGWDGTYSVLTRKRVARHIDQCDVCEERRAALVAPLGTLALGPAVAVFTVPDGALDGVRGRVLDAFDFTPAGAGAVGSGEAGPGADGRRRLVLVAAIVLVLLVVGAALVASLPGDDGESVATATSNAMSTTSAGDSSSSAVSTTAGPTSTTAAGATTVPVSPNHGGSTTLPLTATTGPGGAGAPPAASPPVTLAPAPPATTPNQPPALGSTIRSGTSTMQTTCNPANDTRTITVPVSDDQAVAAVVLRWTQPGGSSGQKAMARSGSSWTATLGPFADPGSVTYRAVATDGDGASAASPTASVTIDPCPG
jgi:RNA polymerase sigma factor (sigma-70 family)